MQNHGQKHADGDVENHVYERPDDGFKEDGPKELLPKDGDVLIKSNQAPIADMINIRVGEREYKVKEKRKSNDGKNDEQSRTEQHGQEYPDFRFFAQKISSHRLTRIYTEYFRHANNIPSCSICVSSV